MTISRYFLLFIMYAMIGWVVEMIYCVFDGKKMVNRGFLIGPYCPIYGFGALAITILLKRYLDDPIVLFVMAVFICSIIEYFTSYIMEKIYKTRWWDYSDKKYNLNGRICLETMIPFGVLGVFVSYLVNPFFLKVMSFANPKVESFIAIAIFSLFLIDNILSFNILSKLSKEFKSATGDSTEKITEFVKKKLTKETKYFGKRIVNAFPSLKYIIKDKSNH